MRHQLGLVRAEVDLIAHSLPAELGPLPLHLDGDGFYSVLGPPLSHTIHEDQVNESTGGSLAYSHINTSAPLMPPRSKVFCGSLKCSGNSGPHTCSRRSYTCNAPSCTRPTPFRTKQALNRHYEAIHLAVRFNCPVPGCGNNNQNGIKRYDNLITHVRNKHSVSLVGGSWEKFSPQERSARTLRRISLEHNFLF
ncbi:hypothetical protein B9Z19DRAFT_686479 [Tuber borchii]|uniref:C2H2-type domain-containing protein n=1 Tax=Tuber borchii TaxID=42251 RepID=A0A2T6ZZD0_TUBBO|nr:hypothetical protein B9Z19DRAFT_686479 [Tuber borchii]